MTWVATVVLLVIAALGFLYTQPQLAPDMTKGLVVAFLTMGVVFGLAPTRHFLVSQPTEFDPNPQPVEAPPKAIDRFRNAAAIIILITGGIVTFFMFTSPLVGLVFGGLVLAGGGFTVFRALNAPRSPSGNRLTTESLTRHSADSTILDDIKETVGLEFQSELLTIKLEVAQKIAALEGIHHQARVVPSAADADIAANVGAAKREIPRANYGAFRMHEAEAETLREMKRFDMKLGLEQMAAENEIKFDAAKRFATRIKAEAESIRAALAQFHRLFHDIKTSTSPASVKKAQLADLTNIIRGLRRDLNERLGFGPDDEDVDATDTG